MNYPAQMLVCTHGFVKSYMKTHMTSGKIRCILINIYGILKQFMLLTEYHKAKLLTNERQDAQNDESDAYRDPDDVRKNQDKNPQNNRDYPHPRTGYFKHSFLPLFPASLDSTGLKSRCQC